MIMHGVWKFVVSFFILFPLTQKSRQIQNRLHKLGMTIHILVASGLVSEHSSCSNVSKMSLTHMKPPWTMIPLVYGVLGLVLDAYHEDMSMGTQLYASKIPLHG